VKGLAPVRVCDEQQCSSPCQAAFGERRALNEGLIGTLRYVFHLSKATLMMLTTRDACRYLDVSMSTLSLWIAQRGLPAQLVGGRYSISRSELLDWAIVNRLEVYPELLNQIENG
jgi:excisionase family DNA binding protein